MRTDSPRRFPGWFFPDRWLLALAVAGFLTELGLLARSSEGVFQSARLTCLTGVGFLAWFWLSAAWLTWLMAGVLTVLAARLPGWCRWVLPTIWCAIGAVAGAAYTASWVLYLESDQFADWESLRFLVADYRLLRLYVAQTEWRSLVVVGGLLLAGAAHAGWYWRRTARRQRPVRRDAGQGARICWYACTAVWLVLFWQASASTSLHRLARQEFLLRHQLNPVATLAATCWEASAQERIDLCLTPAELRPRHTSDRAGMPVATHPRNIILITIESLRPDVLRSRHQGLALMPRLDELAEKGRHWRRFYTASTQTDYATAALFGSVYPLWTRRHHYFQPQDPWPTVLLHEALRRAGYVTALVSSQDTMWGGIDHFLRARAFDFFYDPMRAGTGGGRSAAVWANNLPDAETITHAIAWLRQQGVAGRPFLLAINLQSTHFPYRLPPGCERVFEPCDPASGVQFLSYPPAQSTVLRNAYNNALRECDRQIDRVVGALQDAGLWTNSVLLVCGDHGQAFGERGYVTHGREPIDSVARTTALLVAPGRVVPGTEDYPVSALDVAPTLLGLVGLPVPADWQGIDVLASDRPPAADRLLFLHTENPISRCDAVVLAGRWKYLWERDTGRESLYDLETDPEEASDQLAREAGLGAGLRAAVREWRRRQLAYYAYAGYYRQFYPPSPPIWHAVTARSTPGNRPE